MALFACEYLALQILNFRFFFIFSAVHMIAQVLAFHVALPSNASTLEQSFHTFSSSKSKVIPSFRTEWVNNP